MPRACRPACSSSWRSKADATPAPRPEHPPRDWLVRANAPGLTEQERHVHRGAWAEDPPDLVALGPAAAGAHVRDDLAVVPGPVAMAPATTSPVLSWIPSASLTRARKPSLAAPAGEFSYRRA